MKISIITVSRNAAATIGDTLDSVRGQGYGDIEHIVVDGASSDDTSKVLARRGQHVDKLISEPDDGLYHAMNKGIAAATGDVVGTLNADDVYAHANVIGTVAGLFGDPAVDACYADLVYVDREDLHRVIRYWTSKPFQPGSFRTGWLPAHPTFFVRREVYRKYGAFDLDYRIQSDFELTMRLLEVHRIRSVYVPEVWIRMRMGGATNNSLMNIVKGNLESYRACKKHAIPVSPWFFVTKIGQRLPQFIKRPVDS